MLDFMIRSVGDTAKTFQNMQSVKGRVLGLLYSGLDSEEHLCCGTMLEFLPADFLERLNSSLSVLGGRPSQWDRSDPELVTHCFYSV